MAFKKAYYVTFLNLPSLLNQFSWGLGTASTMHSSEMFTPIGAATSWFSTLIDGWTTEAWKKRKYTHYLRITAKATHNHPSIHLVKRSIHEKWRGVEEKRIKTWQRRKPISYPFFSSKETRFSVNQPPFHLSCSCSSNILRINYIILLQKKYRYL